jgi:hypothetical protein
MFESDSELHAELNGLYGGIRTFKQMLRETESSARDDRDEISRSIDANLRRIAAIKAELDERREGRAENRAAREEQYRIKEGLIEANRMLREELGQLPPDDGELRREIYQTLDANGRGIGEANREITRLKRER